MNLPCPLRKRKIQESNGRNGNSKSSHRRLVTSDSLQLYGLQPARLLCPRGSPGKTSAVGCHSLFQGVFLTQGLSPSLLQLLRWQADSSIPEPPGEPQSVFIRQQFTINKQAKFSNEGHGMTSQTTGSEDVLPTEAHFKEIHKPRAKNGNSLSK